MRTSDIMKIFGLKAYNDKILRTDKDILRVIAACKKLSDSTRVDIENRRKKAQ